MNYTPPCFLCCFQDQFTILFVTSNLNSIAEKAGTRCLQPKQRKLVERAFATYSNRFRVVDPSNINDMVHTMKFLGTRYFEQFDQMISKLNLNDQISFPIFIFYLLEIHTKGLFFYNYVLNILITDLVNLHIYFSLIQYWEANP